MTRKRTEKPDPGSYHKVQYRYGIFNIFVLMSYRQH